MPLKNAIQVLCLSSAFGFVMSVTASALAVYSGSSNVLVELTSAGPFVILTEESFIKPPADERVLAGPTNTPSASANFGYNVLPAGTCHPDECAVFSGQKLSLSASTAVDGQAGEAPPPEEVKSTAQVHVIWTMANPETDDAAAPLKILLSWSYAQDSLARIDDPANEHAMVSQSARMIYSIGKINALDEFVARQTRSLFLLPHKKYEVPAPKTAGAPRARAETRLVELKSGERLKIEAKSLSRGQASDMLPSSGFLPALPQVPVPAAGLLFLSAFLISGMFVGSSKLA